MKSFEDLFAELKLKAKARPEGSGTVKDIDARVHKIGKKLVEEAHDTWHPAEYESRDVFSSSVSKLTHHAQVLMIANGVSLAAAYRNL